MDLEVTKTVVDRETVEAEANGVGEANGAGITLKATPNGEYTVDIVFLRRYIHHAKSFSPVLTPLTRDLISQHYVQLREEQQGEANATKDGFFVTPRTLEALIRLSTAHAKLRLSNSVDEEDVVAAMTLLRASVNAATSAADQRTRDNEDVRAPTEGAAAGGRSPPTGEAAALERERERDLDRSDERPRTKPRLETSLATPAPTHMSTDASVSRIIVDTLTLFRRERRSEVHLHELRDRLTQSALARGMDLDLPSLQRAVSDIAASQDMLTFESTATEDIIRLL
jgi:DNA replication licensing factor MCM3